MSAEQGEVISEPDFSTYCRLCAVKSDGGNDIFTAKGVELCLAEKIGRCLPVVVSIASCFVLVVW